MSVYGVPLQNATRTRRMATGRLEDGAHELTVETANGTLTLSTL
ncbi:hypothetical protein [Halalkaliarchaeum desulfuricum]|nr:hypothetical protein [Halalkaliarchaeum desulfuricum]